jgi:hypothetical protein
MTYDELLIEINRRLDVALYNGDTQSIHALRAVVKLHKPSENYTGNACGYCFDLAYEPTGLSMEYEDFAYPCATIRVIEKELSNG